MIQSVGFSDNDDAEASLSDILTQVALSLLFHVENFLRRCIYALARSEMIPRMIRECLHDQLDCALVESHSLSPMTSHVI